MYKLFLLSLILVGCNSVMTKTTTTKKELIPINIHYDVDHKTTLNLLSPAQQHNDDSNTIAITTPKHAEKEDSTQGQIDGLGVNVKYTTVWDSGEVSTTINDIEISGNRQAVSTKEEIIETPYCNRKLYILIGFAIGAVVVVAIRKLLT